MGVRAAARGTVIGSSAPCCWGAAGAGDEHRQYARRHQGRDAAPGLTRKEWSDNHVPSSRRRRVHRNRGSSTSSTRPASAGTSPWQPGKRRQGANWPARIEDTSTSGFPHAAETGALEAASRDHAQGAFPTRWRPTGAIVMEKNLPTGGAGLTVPGRAGAANHGHPRRFTAGQGVRRDARERGPLNNATQVMFDQYVRKHRKRRKAGSGAAISNVMVE